MLGDLFDLGGSWPVQTMIGSNGDCIWTLTSLPPPPLRPSGTSKMRGGTPGDLTVPDR